MRFAKVTIFCKRFLPFVLMALALFIPISYRVTIYLLDIAFITWFLSYEWYKNLKTAFRNRIVFFSALFLLLAAFSLLYTKNIETGTTKITQYISILLVPLMFATQSSEIGKYKVQIERSFILGLLLTAFYLLVRALSRSIFFTPVGVIYYPIPPEDPQGRYFFYQHFTEPFHPTYLAMYYSLGIAMLVFRIKQLHRVWPKVLGFVAVTLFMLMIYFASSNAGYISGMLVCIVSFLWLLKYQNRRYVFYVFIPLLVGFGVLLLNNDRFVNFMGYFRTQSDGFSENSSFEYKLKKEGTVRLKIWQIVPAAVGKNWLFGVGIGDVRETLAKTYQEKNLDFALSKRLNAHNQYLETFVGLGLVGLSYLLMILGSALWQSVRRRDMVFFLFMLIILVNFMFESVLERFFGVLFFVFFLSLFSMREVDSV
jgi:O-antigen ligase